MSSTWPKVRAPEDGSLTWIKPNIYTDYNRSSIKSHATNTNPTPLPPSHVNPNPNRPTKWTSVLIHQKPPHNGIKTPTLAFLVQRSANTSATELCDGYVYSAVVMGVPYTGKFRGQKGKRESRKPETAGRQKWSFCGRSSPQRRASPE